MLFVLFFYPTLQALQVVLLHRPIIQVTYVTLSGLCVLGCAKMAESINIPFRQQTCMGPTVQESMYYIGGAHWHYRMGWIRLNDMCAVPTAKAVFSLLWALVTDLYHYHVHYVPYGCIVGTFCHLEKERDAENWEEAIWIGYVDVSHILDAVCVFVTMYWKLGSYTLNVLHYRSVILLNPCV